MFTTRPDTLFGATYLVLAPEHELVSELLNQESGIGNRGEVQKYVEQTAGKTELERMSESKEKTGVELKGVKAINPANNEKIPVFISDYVLARYGTGAIMAVPGHDERDYDFAKRFKLPIVEVIKSDLGADKRGHAYEGEGVLVNSGKFDGMRSEEAREAITKFVKGKKKIQYRLRDWLVSRQRYWGAPIPIVYCDECGEQPVPEEDLPVRLPMDVDFKPTGVSPLKGHEKFMNVKCPACKGPAVREADTLDTFVDSSWYYLRYIDPKNKKAPFDKEKVKRVMPVDLYMGGAEHAVLHLLYARFIYKVLADAQLVPEREPFSRLVSQGLVLAPGGEKMSKSKGNVIIPDEVVEEYGADTLRTYLVFMGPWEDAKPWDTRGIVGVFRFFAKAWRLSGSLTNRELSVDMFQMVHASIDKITRDVESFSLNTAVSQLMIFLSAIEKEPSRGAFKNFLLLLYPFAPHLASELWEKLEYGGNIWEQEWPKAEKKYLVKKEVVVAVQVNGKLRDTVSISAGTSDKELQRAAEASEKVQRHLKGKKAKNVVVVKDRLVNFVTE